MCIVLTLPITVIVVSSSSNPTLLSALHVITSELFASVIVILLTSPAISVPLRNHLMVIGGVPLTVVQSIVTLYPSRTYTGLPIVTLLFSSVMLVGLSICGPSSISGGLPKRNKDYVIV